MPSEVEQTCTAAPIDEVLAVVGSGGIVVIIDDSGPVHAHLAMAAELTTEEHVAFFIERSCGLLCAVLTSERCEELHLDLQPRTHAPSRTPAFTVTVDHLRGTMTGISAHDRAVTLRALADNYAGPDDFARPGHVLPIRVEEGGVLRRAGVPEAAVDMCALAGLQPVALVAQIVDDDGDTPRPAVLADFCRRSGLPAITSTRLAEYRHRHEQILVLTGEATVATEHGVFTVRSFGSRFDHTEHLALTLGDLSTADVVTWVGSQCILGSILGSPACGSRKSQDLALAQISELGAGVAVLVRDDPEVGCCTDRHRGGKSQQGPYLGPDEDAPRSGRTGAVAAGILRTLGVSSVRLLGQQRGDAEVMAGFGIDVSNAPLPVHGVTPAPPLPRLPPVPRLGEPR